MQLLPGSNPVFGLNTLGGALTIRMKDGFRLRRRASAEASAGSFGRTSRCRGRGRQRRHAGRRSPRSKAIDDDGWRDHSATRIGRLYARGDGARASDQASLRRHARRQSAEGTQALPLSMLGNPRQPYTWPDTTDNRLAFVNAQLARMRSTPTRCSPPTPTTGS